MKDNKQNNDYNLVRLFNSNKEQLTSHLCSLSLEDRSLRFNAAISPEIIAKYTQNTLNTENTREYSDFWFGITTNDQLVATLHIAIRDDTAEFAFTTDEQHRDKKLGQLLFARGYQLVTEYSIEKIYLTCLSQNKAMQHIAKKFGLKFTYSGQEIEALTYVPNPVSITDMNSVKNTYLISSH